MRLFPHLTLDENYRLVCYLTSGYQGPSEGVSTPPRHSLILQKSHGFCLRVREQNLWDFDAMLLISNVHSYDVQLKQLRIRVVVANFCNNVNI